MVNLMMDDNVFEFRRIARRLESANKVMVKYNLTDDDLVSYDSEGLRNYIQNYIAEDRKILTVRQRFLKERSCKNQLPKSHQNKVKILNQRHQELVRQLREAKYTLKKRQDDITLLMVQFKIEYADGAENEFIS
ncbi:hypothetical protein RF11_15713 [Thelohanellus kitauei]|uniref:Uncharacterized protein n=1 Tax=Thelohanellus kitauei TaxID=669202 RepID=A0A0C2N0N0_THEKT|nr:hypothetical protein RF11_15713 [Thelohanellus kitauei]